MSRTLFIADLHLCQQQPAITAGFLHFLQQETQEIDGLYILGDLFEAWIGDDDPDPLHALVADALLQLKKRHIPVWFIHGNRDFLLGSRFAALSGMSLLPEKKVIELYGRRILIMHGDTLCTDDQEYQRFRRKVHQRWIQKLFLCLPLFIRQKIASRLRSDSSRANQHKSDAIMDVNQQSVSQIMQQYDVQWLIHGHTHRPATHQLDVRGQPVTRVVLGAWHDHGSMVEVDQKGIRLLSFPFDGITS